MEVKLVLPKKIRLISTILDHFVSSLSHCKCAIQVNVKTNSRMPTICAKYHNITYLMWCYILHIRAWCLEMSYSTIIFRLMMVCIISTKLNLLGFLLEFHCLTRSIHEVWPWYANACCNIKSLLDAIDLEGNGIRVRKWRILKILKTWGRFITRKE
jgi:hypothetical protein